MREAQPGVMAGFAKMHANATADGVLPGRFKELIALAVSITGHCDGCVGYHVHDALRAGATAEEIAETVGVAVMMGGGAAAVYGYEALDALEQFTSAAPEQFTSAAPEPRSADRPTEAGAATGPTR